MADQNQDNYMANKDDIDYMKQYNTNTTNNLNPRNYSTPEVLLAEYDIPEEEEEKIPELHPELPGIKPEVATKVQKKQTKIVFKDKKKFSILTLLVVLVLLMAIIANSIFYMQVYMNSYFPFAYSLAGNSTGLPSFIQDSVNPQRTLQPPYGLEWGSPIEQAIDLTNNNIDALDLSNSKLFSDSIIKQDQNTVILKYQSPEENQYVSLIYNNQNQLVQIDSITLEKIPFLPVSLYDLGKKAYNEYALVYDACNKVSIYTPTNYNNSKKTVFTEDIPTSRDLYQKDIFYAENTGSQFIKLLETDPQKAQEQNYSYFNENNTFFSGNTVIQTQQKRIRQDKFEEFSTELNDSISNQESNHFQVLNELVNKHLSIYKPNEKYYSLHRVTLSYNFDTSQVLQSFLQTYSQPCFAIPLQTTSTGNTNFKEVNRPEPQQQDENSGISMKDAMGGISG